MEKYVSEKPVSPDLNTIYVIAITDSSGQTHVTYVRGEAGKMATTQSVKVKLGTRRNESEIKINGGQ